MPPSSLRDKREALVQAHMASEEQRRFDETLSTFRSPRYELYFDLLTALRQLGIARDPTSVGGRIATFVNHPLVVGRAFADQLRKRPR